MPDREMPARAGQVAGGDEIAIGEQHRRVGLLGLDAGGVDRHDVGTVEEIGEAAEAFRLALGAVDRARTIEAHELGVGGWVDDGLDLQPERAVRRLRDGEPVGGRDELFGRKRRAVEFQPPQVQRIAIERERRRGRAVPVGPQRQGRAHPRRGRIELYVEFHRLDQPVGRAVIFQANGTGFFGAHIASMSLAAPMDAMAWGTVRRF